MLIRVEPVKLLTDDSVISVAVEDRKCRLVNEVPEEMKHLFKNYVCISRP